ncbi:MAG: tetratricopeptide repeat protein [Phycisphaerales bacterium]|nr:MAG: tetratricopeptide repeat protein [Phycisphaerales bacterium]
MRSVRRVARINVKVLVILVLVAGVIVVGAGVGRTMRKRAMTERALAAGQAALKQKDWPQACAQLKIYLSNRPDDAEVLYQYAKANLAVRPLGGQNVSAARGAFRRLLQLKPGDDEICEQLARIYFSTRDFGEAAHVCRQRLVTDPDDADAALWLAKSLVAQGSEEEAVEVLESLVAKHPDQVEAFALLSAAVMRDGAQLGATEALKSLRDAVDQNPKSAEALAYRARFYRAVRDDPEAARADLEDADRLAAEETCHPATRLFLAEEWMQLGDLDRAGAQLEEAERIDAEALAAAGIDEQAYAFQWFVTSGALANLRDAKEEAGVLADRACQELTGATRIAFLPMAAELQLAAGRVEDARKVIDEYRKATRDEVGRGDALLREKVNLLDAAVTSAEGRHRAAIDLLEELVVSSPDNASAWKLLWRTYDATDQSRRALVALQKYIAREPHDPEATLSLARVFRHRDWGKVRRYADQAERAMPDSLNARLLRIEAQIHSDPTQDAASALQRELQSLRQAHPTRDDIRILQAKLALTERRNDEAVAELEQAIEQCEPNLRAALMLARLLHTPLGELDKAIEVCSAAIERYPDRAAPRIALAELQLAAGRYPDARNTLTRAVEHLEGEERVDATYALTHLIPPEGERSTRVELLTRLAADRPGDPRPRLALLDLPEIQTNGVKAQALIDELIEIEGPDGVLWRAAQARLWLLRGDHWRDRKQQIEDMLRHCISVDPAWDAPILALGDMYERLLQYDKAEELYRQAMAEDSARLGVIRRLLAVLQRQGRFAEADAILDRLPEDAPELRLDRASVAIGLEEYESAIEDLKAQIEAKPDDAASHVLLARVIYEHRRDTESVEQVLKLLEKARALNPQLDAPLSVQVAILNKQGRGDEALALLDDEVDSRGDFGSYWRRAEYYTATGQLEAAEADYIHLTTFAEKTADGYAALAGFYLKNASQDKAIAACENGLKVDADHVPLRRILATACLTSPEPEQQERGEQILDQLLSEMPDDKELLFLQASVKLAARTQEATAEARKILQRLVELEPRHVPAHLQLVQLAHVEGDSNRQGDLITRALIANPGDSRLLLARARLEADRDALTAARQFARAAEETDAQNTEARYLRILLALEADDVDEARSLTDELLEADTTSEVAQLAHARVLAAQQRVEEAIQALEAYRRTRPDPPGVQVLLLLADLYLSNEDLEASGQCLDEAERRDPTGAAVRLARVRWLAARQEYDGLPPLLEEHSLEDPGQLQVVIVGASALAESGRENLIRKAKALFEQVQRRYPRRIEGPVGIAVTAYRLGERDATVQAYWRVLELDPDHQRALNDLAWVLGVEEREAEEGLELANRGVDSYPNDPHLLDTRGVLLTRLGRLPEARADLERCLEAAAGIPVTECKARLHLGQVYVELGEQEAALRTLKEASGIDEQNDVLDAEERAELKRLIEAAESQP